MLSRCRNPKCDRWKYYGGRGIQVCRRWLKFENFLGDMGARPVGKTLDRIDVNGDYTSSNCRWATAAEQRANRRDFRPSEEDVAVVEAAANALRGSVTRQSLLVLASRMRAAAGLKSLVYEP